MRGFLVALCLLGLAYFGWLYETQPILPIATPADTSPISASHGAAGNDGSSVGATPSALASSAAAAQNSPALSPPSVPIATQGVASDQPSAFIPPDPLPAKPDWTWKTSDGKIYRKVVVKKVEADCVTILDDEGGGLIEISLLPPDIQSQLNYDPGLSAQATAQRQKQEAADRDAVNKEKALAQQATTLTDQQTEAIRTTANTAADQQAEALREEEAVKEISSYQEDLDFATKHLHDSDEKISATSLGSVPVNAFYEKKCEEDEAAIQQLRLIANPPQHAPTSSP